MNDLKKLLIRFGKCYRYYDARVINPKRRGPSAPMFGTPTNALTV